MKGSNGAVLSLDDSASQVYNHNDSLRLFHLDSAELLRAFSSKSLVIHDENFYKNLNPFKSDFYLNKYNLLPTKDSSNTLLRASSSKSMVISPDMITLDSKKLSKINSIHGKLLQDKSNLKHNDGLLHQVFQTFLYTGFSLLLLALIFIPLEKVFPVTFNQKILRENWNIDLCYFLGQYLIWNYLILKFLAFFEIQVQFFTPSAMLKFVNSQPFYLQCIEVVLLSDILLYWAHRWQHHSKFLWRFHKVHHSAETMDWLASHREHPLDTLYTLLFVNLPAMILGFSLSSIAFLVIFRGIWAIYIHSNVKLNIGFFKYVFGSPQLHHWHHDVNKHKGNYANVSPLMDLMFGTYYEQSEFPDKYGINEKIPQNYFMQILEPLIPKKLLLKKNKS